MCGWSADSPDRTGACCSICPLVQLSVCLAVDTHCRMAQLPSSLTSCGPD